MAGRPPAQKQDMCGLGVVIEELPNTQGYDLYIDNDSATQETRVDFDFSGSDNLAILDKDSSVIIVGGPLLATVVAPAGATALKLSLRQIDVKKNIELRLQTTPSEDCMPITLECNVIMKARSLAGLRGYDLRFTNPTDDAITLEFNFEKSENLSVVAGAGTTSVDGFFAVTSVPAGAEDFEFVILETVDPTRQIAMEYSLTSYPTKDADPPATREPLKCGAFLTLQPMPKASGYEFYFDNPIDRVHQLSFDFANSSNLRLEDGGVGVTLEGQVAHVRLAPNQERFLAFALHSVDKTKGVAMSYVLRSEAGEAGEAPETGSAVRPAYQAPPPPPPPPPAAAAAPAEPEPEV